MASENRIKIICSVETIRFYKNEFGIAVVSVDKVKEGKPKTDKFNQIIIKGTMPQLVEGNPYVLVADYVEDPKWGGQYNIISIYSAITFNENDKVGQKKFLSTLFTPLQIENMYDALDDPFDSLKNNRAEDLVKVRGCGLDTAARWIERFNRNIHLAKIFSELEQYNLTNNMVNRLMERYNSPDLVVEKVKNNPYILCNEVKGIGWKTADKIALDSGMEEFCSQRISAFIYKYLEDSGQDGCSWITPDELMGAIIDELGEDVPDMNITEAIHDMGDELWWNEDKTQIGLRKFYNIEDKIAKELIRLRDAKSEITYGDWEDTIKHTYKTNPPIFNGNLGIIKKVFPEDKAVLISFMGIGEVYVEGTQVNSIELGYAITVHKSQGSQFDHVIFGIDFSSYSLLTRELLYTGITRAKKKCDLVAQTGALRMAISKEGVSKKQTHLQQCLYDTAHPKLVF